MIIMSISNSNNAGPIRELSHEYYPVFRGIFLISYVFLLYGGCLFIWRRVKVDYSTVLHVTYAHTYQVSVYNDRILPTYIRLTTCSRPCLYMLSYLPYVYNNNAYIHT